MENQIEDVPTKKPRTKPKVQREWLEEDIYKLISLVEGERCLWDAGDEAYHNKIARDSAWRNIAEHFHTKYEAAELNAKWTNLRIQFRGYASRAKTKSGQGAVEVPKWRFYNAMSFVGRVEDQQSQETVSNIVFEIESDSNSIDNDGSPIRIQRQVATTPMHQATLTQRRQQAAKAESAATQIADTMREAVTVLKKRSQNSFSPNPNFCNYVLSELETLSEQAAASVRNKVIGFFLQCVQEERNNEQNDFTQQ